MFMNPISHVGDLQIHEYNQAVPSNQRIQYNEINSFTSQRFSEIRNNGIIIASNSNGLQWEFRSDEFPTSQAQMIWTRIQPANLSSQRPLVQINGHTSAVRHGKRHRDSDEIPSKNIISMENTSVMSMSFENQENEPNSSASAPNLQPVAKRRKTFPEGTIPYTSPDKMQEINFAPLVDPGDDIISPYNIPSANTDYFVVQTPSKTLNESDQQSFHLSSPISNFGSLGITAVIGHKKTVNSSFKPRVLFRDVSISQNGTPPQNSLTPQSSTLPRVIVNNSSVPRVRQINVSPSATNTTNSSRQHMSVINPLHLPLSSNSDSIAISTAKMTVWNRMATNPPIAPIRTPISVAHISQQNTPVPKQCSNASPIRKLPYHVNKNPELSIRRILQNLTNKQWRLVALGENRHAQSAVQMARLMLDTN